MLREMWNKIFQLPNDVNEEAVWGLIPERGYSSMTREQELEEVLREVVNILESPEMISMFSFMQMHGMPYKGPFINMKKIRRLLNMEPREGDYGE